jgi:ribonuclease BN (tRNA processing enzyme)
MPPIDFHAVSSRSPLDLPQGGRLTAIDLQHPGESLGFRLDWPGHSMAYITDTMADVNDPYVEQIADVDLLVHECYFPDGEEHRARVTGHSCLTPVVEVARRANVRRLALVHTNPLDVELKLLDIPAARKTFAQIIVPNDRDVLEF